MEEYYLICEDSLEGIFSGIYDAYCLKRPHEQIHIIIGEEENYRLFAVYQKCPPDVNKAAKVAGTIGRKFGGEAYFSLCSAMAADDREKGEAVYKTVVTGFSMKNRKELMGNLKDVHVRKVFELARGCANEAHYHKEFLRFRELENGILYGEMRPKNNIITFVTPHFADRLPLENFVIYDKERNIFAMHPSGSDWYLVTDENDRPDGGHAFSKGEEKYGELFCHFFHTIAIKERRNAGLQRNMLPIRYREYMTEFIKN